MDVAIASCRELPEPDTDSAPLLAAMRTAGLDAEILAWDDPGADFSRARVTVIRSTWNYPEAPAAFATWIDRTARKTRLFNPAATVRWNLHKGYLLSLAKAGLSVVPTRLVEKGSAVPLSDVMRELAAADVVVKPAVSAGSRKTLRVTDPRAGEAHLAGLVAIEDALVQPYLPSVEGYGERSIIWIDGEFTHAIRKSRRLQGDAESVDGPMPIAAEEADLARRAVLAAPGPLLYARVDMARSASGDPMLMELELIEPSLFFGRSAVALERYVRGVAGRAKAR